MRKSKEWTSKYDMKQKGKKRKRKDVMSLLFSLCFPSSSLMFIGKEGKRMEEAEES